MSRFRGKRELYEVLRDVRAQKEGAVQPQAEPDGASAAYEAPAAPGPEPIARLDLTPARIVIAGGVLLALLVMAFFVGVGVGKASDSGGATAPPGGLTGPVGPKTQGGVLPVVGDATDEGDVAVKGFYTVRVIALARNMEVRAWNLRKDLEDKTGYDVMVSLSPNGNNLVLYVGKFASKSDPKLKELKDKVRRMKIGRTQFKDAYIVLAQ